MFLLANFALQSNYEVQKWTFLNQFTYLFSVSQPTYNLENFPRAHLKFVLSSSKPTKSKDQASLFRSVYQIRLFSLFWPLF